MTYPRLTAIAAAMLASFSLTGVASAQGGPGEIGCCNAEAGHDRLSSAHVLPSLRVVP